MSIKKEITSYTKIISYSGNAWSGYIYLKNNKILWVDYELYSTSCIYYVNPITKKLNKQIKPHSRLECQILTWFANMPCNKFWDYEHLQSN